MHAITDYYCRLGNGEAVTDPMPLPEIHWINIRQAVPLKDEAGRPLPGISAYGYVPAVTLEAMATKLIPLQLGIINAGYREAVQALVADTPMEERESWFKQEAEAKAYASDTEAPTPYVDGLAAARGVDRVYLLGRILENVAAYEAAHSALTGRRQQLEDALSALPEDCSVADVLAIKWEGA